MTEAQNTTTPRISSDDIRLKRTVAALIRDRLGRVLVQDHVKHNMLTIPVGKAEVGEDAAAAMAREVQEETGVRPTGYRLLKSVPHVFEIGGTKTKKRVNLYEVTGYSGTPRNIEPAKHRFVRFMTVKALANLARRRRQEIGFATRLALGDQLDV